MKQYSNLDREMEFRSLFKNEIGRIRYLFMTLTFLIISFTLLAGFFSCEKQSFLIEPKDEVSTDGETPPPEWWKEDFFYYFGEKIYLRQKADQILLKTAPNIYWTAIAPLINADSSLTVSVAFWTETSPVVLLMSKDGKPIPLTTLDSILEIPEIVSASYEYLPYQYKPGIYLVTHGAFTDEFLVKLKKTTSYEQLKTLTQQNGCILGEEDQFEKNQYRLYVPKTSDSNVIQMSKLFYETGLFDNSSPNVFMISGSGEIPPQVPTSFFYYYWSEKIYLQQVTDKIFLTFAPDVNREQILTIIKSDASLQQAFGMNDENYTPHYVALETKNGKTISLTTFESFKAKKEVVSVSYMYQVDGSQGFLSVTDELIVKLMPTTSYEQLQELAEKYNCTVGEENQYSKNQYMLYVSKTSDFDALKTSNLLYETGYFEWAEPNFVSYGMWKL